MKNDWLAPFPFSEKVWLSLHWWAQPDPHCSPMCLFTEVRRPLSPVLTSHGQECCSPLQSQAGPWGYSAVSSHWSAGRVSAWSWRGTWVCTWGPTRPITLQSQKHIAHTLFRSASELSGVAAEFQATWLIQFTSNSWSYISGKFSTLPTILNFFPWVICSPFFGITKSCLYFSP